MLIIAIFCVKNYLSHLLHFVLLSLWKWCQSVGVHKRGDFTNQLVKMQKCYLIRENNVLEKKQTLFSYHKYKEVQSSKENSKENFFWSYYQLIIFHILLSFK